MRCTVNIFKSTFLQKDGINLADCRFHFFCVCSHILCMYWCTYIETIKLSWNNSILMPSDITWSKIHIIKIVKIFHTALVLDFFFYILFLFPFIDFFFTPKLSFIYEARWWFEHQGNFSPGLWSQNINFSIFGTFIYY